MPGIVVSIKVLQTPRFSMSAQPAVLLLAFSWDGWVGETQFPIDLSTHIYLPVMETRIPALGAQDVKGGVKTSVMLRDILPYICESGTVPFRWNNQLGMGSGRVQDRFWGICKMNIGSKTNCLHRIRSFTFHCVTFSIVFVHDKACLTTLHYFPHFTAYGLRFFFFSKQKIKGILCECPPHGILKE